MKKTKVYDFKVIIEPDEAGGYVVSRPSLIGCYSQGETIEEALENIKEAILVCLEDMEERVKNMYEMFDIEYSGWLK